MHWWRQCAKQIEEMGVARTMNSRKLWHKAGIKLGEELGWVPAVDPEIALRYQVTHIAQFDENHSFSAKWITYDSFI